MRLAKYKGELYQYSKEKKGIEIWIKEKKEGFEQRKWDTDIISYKIVREDELEEIFEVHYYATWKGDQYAVAPEDNQTIWINIGDVEYKREYFRENGFTMIDRGEFEKIVPESECSDFIMIKKCFEDKKWIEKEKKKLTLDEFKKSYYENVERFF